MQLNKDIFLKLKENVVAFRNFNDGEMLEILKSTQREIFQPDEIVFKEGTRGDKMYIIITGGIKISRYMGKSREEVLAVLETGQLFGEMGPIDQSPRSARATAVGNTVLLSLREAILRENNLGLAYKLYKNFSVMLAERLRATNERLTDLSMQEKEINEKVKNLVKSRLDKGRSIKGTDLRNADMTGVFLGNSDLRDSLFLHANFKEARMKGANMQNGKFVNAVFQGADLSGANFTGADFSGAQFNEVNFSNAIMKTANFTAVTLNEAVLPEGPKKPTIK